MTSLLNDLVLLPVSFPFMQRALVIAVAVGLVAAVLSCFLLLRGWALMGDAISHAVLPGIVVAYIVGLPFALGAFVAGLGCALATGYVHGHSRIKEDTALGVVFSGLFALGLVLFTAVPSDQHLNHILFGNMLGVEVSDIVETLLVAVPVTGFVLARRRDLLLIAFDRAQAHALGLNVGRLDAALLAGLALTIVAAVKAVGVVLVIGLLIAPGATALLLTRRFDAMLGLACLSALAATVSGAFLSFHLDLPAGPAIILVQTALFGLALAASLARAARAQASLSSSSSGAT